ncbi:hypothetical protein ANN_04128 [Periplaneta americana]|uniref:Uncharacterized protein n=1 Tax=Periplaneta americana TaxID=6978 RepID=A0ABQ8T7Q9_PERAM|nr:hypothetical protein ANN_04128 [Periplaneta americana]
MMSLYYDWHGDEAAEYLFLSSSSALYRLRMFLLTILQDAYPVLCVKMDGVNKGSDFPWQIAQCLSATRTCWETLLKAAECYNGHISKVKDVVSSLEDETGSTVSAKEVMEDSGIQRDLAFLKSHFTFLVHVIASLEAVEKSLYE